MANAALLMNENPDRMPFVRFERRPIEDKAATLAAGHYVAKDVDYALVTPPYSKDVMHHKVVDWFGQLKVDVANGRIPAEWVEKIKQSYEAFKNGQELPVDGFPIKGWGIISPAQQETLIKMHILTVEQLAAATEEGIRRIGMGGLELKTKADAWLKQIKKSGPATVEIAALKKENAELHAAVSMLEEKVEALTKLAKRQADDGPITHGTGISADDLMDD